MATEAELETAARCIAPLVRGRAIRDAGVVKGSLDLCLFFEDRPDASLHCLRLATGGPKRARLGLEPVRMRAADWLDGEVPRALKEALTGSCLTALRRVPGERRIELDFTADARPLRLVAECFGPKGGWFLLDADGTIRTLAYRLKGARADLVPGVPYRPPQQGAKRADIDVATPEAPLEWLAEHAERFEAIDREERFATLEAAVARALARERKGIAGRIRGLQSRQAAEGDTELVRREAELLLAQPDVKRRGLASVEVQDWYAGGAPRKIALDPKLTLQENATRRFDRVRRLEEGAAHTATQLALATGKLDSVAELEQQLERAREGCDLELLEELAGQAGAGTGKAEKARRKPPPRKPYHEFTSAEGFPIWVGRTRQDNDRLTLQLARGNDVWLHAGAATAGSHVVIRLDRGKTASLESLLDAATLALYFSKARGRPEGDVLYTPRKHVRKPKGFPPGQVEVLRSKTLHVRVEPDRLRRLLDGDSGE